MRRSARTALKLAACALAGAVLTVAVAWGCAVLLARPVQRIRMNEWSVRPPSGWPELDDGYALVGMGLSVSNEWQWQEPGKHHLLTTMSGWPLHAMSGGVASWVSEDGARFVEHGFRLREEGSFPRYLPTHPLWPGFGLDTLFYGALVFLLWSAPGVVRRRIRMKRGRCPACGYDLRGSCGGRCPECGFQREGREEREEELSRTPS